jgi:O-6-methylguanine DNA methyltransferase
MDTEQPRTLHASILALKAAKPGNDPCDVACEAMPGYVVGDLPEADQAWLHIHTSTCRYCLNELQWYERIDNLLEHVTDADEKCKCPELNLPDRKAGRIARYGTVPSPIGDLLVAVSDEGICEVSFARNGSENFFSELEQRGFTGKSDQAAIDDAAEQLREYFGGRRQFFDMTVDLSGMTPFTQQVLKATASVPFGKLSTYRDIARTIGKPGATRAVGNALGRNPIAIVVPCHRIVRSDWSIGGYTGGLDIKQRLLSIEGSALSVH